MNCAAICRRADILIAALDSPEAVHGDWIKPGAVVIDVGINVVAGYDGVAVTWATSNSKKRRGWHGRSRRCQAASAR